MSGWYLHGGCIPCAFVCHCCDRIKHRCGSGEDMWVFNPRSVYGDGERILCDLCYHHKDGTCVCRASLEKSGDFPVEIDKISGSRKVLGKCCQCYYKAYPCGSCLWYTKNDGEATMTYAEFLQEVENNTIKKYPEDYEDFLSQKQHPKAVQE